MTDPSRIVRAAALSAGVSVRRILGPWRHRRYTRARDVAALVMRWEGQTFENIGQALGGRDHSTVMQGAQRAGLDLDLLAAAADVAVRVELERSVLT